MLEINKESLHNKILEHKNHIGFDWIKGALTIAAGLAFVCTIISGNISNILLITIFSIFAGAQILYGGYQIYKAIITKFSAEELYKEIEALDVSFHRYSLVAIRDSFRGFESNRILAKYYEDDWDEFMFLSFPTAIERDEDSLKDEIAGALKIPANSIHVFHKAAFYQPKFSKSKKWNKVRAYYHTYYVVYVDSFPEHLKKDEEFIIDGIRYKWMTLKQMEQEAADKETNEDVRQTFSRYIYTPNQNDNIIKEPSKAVLEFPFNVCIRLNRKCSLSCKFCLACDNKDLELSTDNVKQCLRVLKSNGVKRARLCGGEPTAHPGILEIVKYSLSLNMETIIYSNLYDVEDVLPELKKLPVSVVTSIHGDKQYHDEITQIEGSYEKTCENIKQLINAGIPTMLHMVLTNTNVDKVEFVIQKAIELGVKKVTIQTLIPRENGRYFMDQSNLNPLVLRQNLEKVKNDNAKYRNDIELHFNDLYEKNYYVLEPDGAIYLETGNGSNDQLFRRLI